MANAERKADGSRMPLMKIVFMGDSITFGQYVDQQLRWTDLLADCISRKYIQMSVNFLFANRGVSGETTRQGLERFPNDVQAIRPDIMTLQFGLNDCNCWVTDEGLPRVSEAAYRANLFEMIERARRFGARRIILSTNHPTLRHKILLSGESLETRRKRYNQIVREVAQAGRVILCDIEDAFGGLSGTMLGKLLLPYPDQLHLTGLGHQRYAEAIKPLLESAIEEAIMWTEENDK